MSFTDDASNEEALTSAATTAVEASPNKVPTGAPIISGMAEVGQTLYLFVGVLSLGIRDGNGMTYAAFSYQWIRSDGTTDSEIPDANGSSYTLVDVDEGKTIKMRVSYTDDGANEETVNSSQTTAVVAMPTTSDLEGPTNLIVRWARGEVKGIELAWVAPEGTVTGYQILRKEEPVTTFWRWWEPLPYGCTPLMEVHVDNTGNDATTYTDTDVAEGALYTYSVRAIDSEGVSSRSSFSRYRVNWPSGLLESPGIPSIPQETASSSPFLTGFQYRPHGYWPSGVPGTPNWPPTNLSSTNIKGDIGLTWEVPTWGEVTGYQILRRLPEQCEHGGRVYAEITDSAVTRWADRDVEPGTLYKYYIRAINDVGAGGLSRNSTSIRPWIWVDWLEVPGGYEAAPPEPNIPATGVLTITGTAQVGETLSADVSGIADTDGLDWAMFSYQWLSDDAEITDATTSVYILTTGEVGKAIKVRVSFTDDEDNDETLTSGPTVAVAASVPGVPRSVAAGPAGTGRLEVTWQAPESDGGSEVTGYKVQWKEASDNWDTAGEVSEGTATGTTHTITGLDLDVEYSVRVLATNVVGDGLPSGEVTATPEAQTSQQQVATQNTPATGAPTISGSAQVGETVTVSTSGIADEDGLDNATFGYQWIRNDSSSDADIEDATGTIYTLEDADEGKNIKVRVSFADDSGNEEVLTSVATAAVAAAPTPLTASTHDAPQGGHDGENEFTFELRFSENVPISYETLRDDAFMVTAGSVTKARRLESPGNVRWEITVEPSSDAAVSIVLAETTDCTATGAICTEDGRMLSAEVSLSVAGPVGVEEQTAPENAPATGVPAISGTAQVGETLTADTSGIADGDGLTGVSYTYQWIRKDGSMDSDIQDATGLTYTPTSEDEGTTIKVRVSFTDDADHQESLISDATTTVSAAPAANNPATGAPTISGTAQVAETLTASTSGISDADGLTNASFTYQWLADDTDISSATSSSYTLVAADQGKVIKVTVSFTDDAGNAETLTSAATAAVTQPPMTAAFHDGPSSHDGSAAFTFELRFSEDIEGLSYTNLQEHAFTVTGGSVSSVRRQEPGKNARWEITVTPDSDADVTTALNATTDCSAEGAICTSDGRMLSGGLELVVPGPPSNSAATGVPTIGGTAQVGETLAASTSSISDADGLANATFTYQWLADDTEISGATGSSHTLAEADAGKAIKVRVSFTDDADNAENLTSEATTAVARPPLTATVHDKPSSHDGNAAFTFELRFSENIEGLSYTTLQEHALTVTGGTLPKVGRLEPGKNVRWEITVQPSSDAGVTIVLPITTDCAAQGAICTSDSRKLSSRVEVMVSGPGG